MVHSPSNFQTVQSSIANCSLPWLFSGEESACSAGDVGSIPGLGRFPEEGNGNPLQYFCLRDPMERGARWATVHGFANSWIQFIH